MEISDLPKDKKIILFDGVCNLCNSSVQFVIKHDKNNIKEHQQNPSINSQDQPSLDRE